MRCFQQKEIKDKIIGAQGDLLTFYRRSCKWLLLHRYFFKKTLELKDIHKRKVRASLQYRVLTSKYTFSLSIYFHFPFTCFSKSFVVVQNCPCIPC